MVSTLPIQMTFQIGQNSNATQYTELMKVFNMMKDYQSGNQVTSEQIQIQIL